MTYIPNIPDKDHPRFSQSIKEANRMAFQHIYELGRKINELEAKMGEDSASSDNDSISNSLDRNVQSFQGQLNQPQLPGVPSYDSLPSTSMIGVDPNLQDGTLIQVGNILYTVDESTHGFNEVGGMAGTSNVSVLRGAAYSLANNALTAIPFDQETYKNGTAIAHDNAVNNTRLTFTLAGIYLLSAYIPFAPNAVGYREAKLRRNGTTISVTTALTPNIGSTEDAIILTTQFRATANDYYEVMAFQNSGGALNLGAALVPNFNAFLIN